YTNTLRAGGMSRREALLEAGPARLRPILMTTITLLFAMIPLALKIGSGAEARSPMAVVVIGGMITSTLLTRVLVPCAYTYLDDLQSLVLRRRPSTPGTVEAPLATRSGVAVAANGAVRTQMPGLHAMLSGARTAVGDEPS